MFSPLSSDFRVFYPPTHNREPYDRLLFRVFYPSEFRPRHRARAPHKTVTAMDVVHALKRRGRILYGFGA